MQTVNLMHGKLSFLGNLPKHQLECGLSGIRIHTPRILSAEMLQSHNMRPLASQIVWLMML